MQATGVNILLRTGVENIPHERCGGKNLLKSKKSIYLLRCGGETALNTHRSIYIQVWWRDSQ